MIQRVRFIIFLRDVFYLSVSCFGGPQAHIAHFQQMLVTKRQYLTETELLELHALCQVLPGPSSTQTLTAVGYKLGGPSLAYLTLLIWLLPSVIIMTAAGMLISSFDAKSISLSFTRFIQPMAVAIIAYSAFHMAQKTLVAPRSFFIMIGAAIICYLFPTPFVFPVVLIIAGCITAFNYKVFPKEEKKKFNIRWSNFLLWAGVLIAAALLGAYTKALPIRLFENFYRNGSLIFGGGQVLTPMLYTEFVQYAPKQYLSHEEFLSGIGFVQALPGPVFSYSAYIGALSMRDFGPGGEILGAIMATAGIFLPGTFLIFFMFRIWESLKKFRAIRASLDGIHAASTGLVVGAAVLLFVPLVNQQPNESILINSSIVLVTFGLMYLTKIPSWAIILAGLAAGFVFS